MGYGGQGWQAKRNEQCGHLVGQVRAAGFVTLYDRNRMTFYALRSGIARLAARLIDDYLRGAHAPPAGE